MMSSRRRQGWPTALLIVALLMLGGTEAAWACSTSSSCETVVDRGGLPACVLVLKGWCIPELTIDNRCEQPVEFVELECAEDCSEPVVFEPGEKGDLLFTKPSTEGGDVAPYVRYPVGWSLDQEDGLLTSTVEYEDNDDVACDDDIGCAIAGGSPAGPGTVGLLAFGLIILGGWRWSRD